MKRDLDAAYQNKQSTLASEAVATASSYIPVVEKAAAIIAEADVLLSFAVTAAQSSGKYVRPKILPLGSGIIRLKVVSASLQSLFDDVLLGCATSLCRADE